jgi:hypothetical protein
MEALDQGHLHPLLKQLRELECYPAGIRSPNPTIYQELSRLLTHLYIYSDPLFEGHTYIHLMVLHNSGHQMIASGVHPC